MKKKMTPLFGARIVSGGAVQAIVRILGEETEEAVVFEAAKCLSNITCDNLMGQQAVSKSGGIQAMVFLLGKKGHGHHFS